MKSCRELGISFFAYLADRLGLNGTTERTFRLPDPVGAQPAYNHTIPESSKRPA